MKTLFKVRAKLIHKKFAGRLNYIERFAYWAIEKYLDVYEYFKYRKMLKRIESYTKEIEKASKEVQTALELLGEIKK